YGVPAAAAKVLAVPMVSIICHYERSAPHEQRRARPPLEYDGFTPIPATQIPAARIAGTGWHPDPKAA
ncbi:MAG TPA: hypothetical protein VFI90_11575, partial [Rubrobacter sp.]|nr:hypothetical protein [Rubrobacter sp.]